MKLLLSCLIFFVKIGFAQKIDKDSIFPSKDGQVIYSEVINVDSTLTKDKLYLNAKTWFVTTYKSAKDVIQLDSKEDGQIIGKGIFHEIWKVSGILGVVYDVSVSHTVKITVKDGKYKYEISDLSGEYYSPSDKYSSGGFQTMVINNTPLSGVRKSSDKFKEACNVHIQSIVGGLKKAMSQSPKKDDF